MSVPSLQTTGDYSGLLVTKVVLKKSFLVQHSLCDQFYLATASNLQESPTTQGIDIFNTENNR